MKYPIQEMESNPFYRPLKSVEGMTVGYVCVECGRLHTAPHREGCSLAADDVPDFKVGSQDRAGRNDA